MDLCIVEYNTEMDPHTLSLSLCGVCGIQVLRSGKVDQLPLTWFSKFQGFLLSTEQRKKHFEQQYHRGYTNLRRNSEVYLLHSKAIQEDGEEPMVDVCVDCALVLHRSKLPKYCVATGFDYGDTTAIGLPPLSIAERKLIALNITLIHLLKLALGQPALKGHLVAFPHDGQQVVATHLQQRRTLPNLNLSSTLMVVIVGSAKEQEILRTSTSAKKATLQQFANVLSVDGRKVYQWLRFLVSCNPLYQDVDILPLEEGLSKEMEGLGERLFDTALYVDADTGPEVVATNDITQPQTVDIPTTNSVLIQQPMAAERSVFLQSVAKGLNSRTGSTQQGEPLVAVRGATPINEFHQNDYFWLGTFPDLFPLGKGIVGKGSLANELVPTCYYKQMDGLHAVMSLSSQLSTKSNAILLPTVLQLGFVLNIPQ